MTIEEIVRKVMCKLDATDPTINFAREAARLAVQAERERCAKIARDRKKATTVYKEDRAWNQACGDITQRIEQEPKP